VLPLVLEFLPFGQAICAVDLSKILQSQRKIVATRCQSINIIGHAGSMDEADFDFGSRRFVRGANC
jgi:hypothetical protein